MHVSLVTSVGVVVDGIIVRRRHLPRAGRPHSNSPCASSSDCDPEIVRDDESFLTPAEADGGSDEAWYECKATEAPLQQTVFHAMDVLPFGFHSPSNVFSVVGRHTNRGLVSGVTSSGLICVRPYRGDTSEPLTAQYVRKRLFRRSVGPEYRVSLSQSWLASVQEQSRDPSVSRDIHAFFATTDSSALTGRQPPAAPMHASSPAHLTQSGSPTSSKSVSGLVSPTMPTRSSPCKATAGGDPTVLCQLLGPTGSAASETSISPTNSHGQRGGAMAAVETYDLRDIALAPALSRGRPTPPLRVGAQVLARRFGCDRVLHPATILAVTYDVAYRLRYESDGGVDAGVMHRDVLLVDDSASETCTVRDRVVVALQLQTTVTIIEACGFGRYRGVLINDPSQEVEFTTLNLVAVAPLLVDALHASPKHVALFRSLDPSHSGQVRWKNVRHAILHMEHFGKSLSFQRMGEIQRDLCILRGHVEPQMLHKVPMQEEEMFLSFNEFEYVMLRALNPL